MKEKEQHVMMARADELAEVIETDSHLYLLFTDLYTVSNVNIAV